MNQTVELVASDLPVLNAGHPIWYRGRLRAVAIDDEVYSVGWVEPRERPVLRAMALAAFEAPHFTPEQQLSFAAYYLLPEVRWSNLHGLPDELIAARTGLPLDLIQTRRSLPNVEPTSTESETVAEMACA